jgi:hypothetical protein
MDTLSLWLWARQGLDEQREGRLGAEPTSPFQPMQVPTPVGMSIVNGVILASRHFELPLRETIRSTQAL